MPRSFVLVVFLLIAGGWFDRCAGQALTAPRCDHHVHLLSARLIGHWKSLGMPFSRADEHYTDPELVLASLGADRAVAVSMAHLYSSRWFQRLEEIGECEADWVRAENDFISRAVSTAPDCWVGLASVNPLRDFADQEIVRAAQLPGIVGLKLHLPACGIDLNNPDHELALQGTLARCKELRLAVLVHLFTGDEPPLTADRFWKLIAAHPELTVIVAHVGTSGGYGDLSHALCTGWQALMQRHPEFREAPVFFDLSGAVLLEETEGLPPTTEENCRRLSGMIEALGPQRFLYATDYPVFSADDVQRALRERLQLSAETIETIMNNQAPLPFDEARATRGR